MKQISILSRFRVPLQVAALFIVASARAADPSTEPIEPINAPFPMPQPVRPVFPNKAFNLRDFGAIEGGAEKNTEAFAKAIEACSKAGGGQVVVPAGKWLTGPIHLRSNIDLHVEDGAELIFSDKPEDYLPPVLVRNGGVDVYNYSPLIYARDCENIAVTGPGLLNGNGKAWWAWKGLENNQSFKMATQGVPVEQRVFGTPQAGIRPSFVSFVNCKNVLLEGFTISSGPAWTIHPIYCENVIIRRVNVDTHGPNNDGMDPDSCRNVLVEHCVFRTGDDCLVLKSGYNEDGWRVGKPTENVVMRYCSTTEGHGALVIGSEMSGGVRNVYMHDCECDRTDCAVRIKSRLDRGGVIENIYVENVKGKDLQREAIILTMAYGSDRQPIVNRKPPVFRNMQFKNVTVDGAGTAISISGVEDTPVDNIRFENIDIHSKKGVTVSDAKDLVFDNVKIASDAGPLFDFKDVSQASIQKAGAPQGGSPFLKVEGKASGGIVIENSNVSEGAVITGADVPAKAVTIQ